MVNNAFSIASFFTSFLLTIVFFRKKYMKNLENKIYSYMIIINMIEVVFALLTYITIINREQIPILNDIISKTLILTMFLWISIFTVYVIFVSISEKTLNKLLKKGKIYKLIFSIFIIIAAVVIYMFPLYYYSEHNIAYSYGPSANAIYMLDAIYVVIWIICIIKNIKKLWGKRYLPILLFILMASIVIYIQKSNPELLLMTAAMGFTTLLMYFTIENPDMKMLREIQQSKEFAEQANNEKAMFLYNTSQELKSPVNAIGQKCEELLQEQDINEIMNGIKDIKFAAKKLATTISGALDMNRTQASNIEIKVSKYSTKMLFQEMISISKLNMKDKLLDFRVKLDENIPEYLMGDSIRLKQIISTIMNNAIKHTEKGFIEFNISSVIKHDVCRLIITIEDSGRGIESKRLETLFYNTEDEDVVDEDRLNNVQDTRESLSVVKILTNLIGGTVIVNSELGKGSKFTVVLDQQIAEIKKSSTEIAVESLSSNKRILVVDNEEENLKQIAKLLSKHEVNVETVEWGQECLEKVRKKQKYDLILLDEDMPRLNGIKTFEKLKLEENFNVPVVIMITNNHIEYKDRYLYNGFSGCVVKPLKKQDVEKLIKKYIKTDE